VLNVRSGACTGFSACRLSGGYTPERDVNTDLYQCAVNKQANKRFVNSSARNCLRRAVLTSALLPVRTACKPAY
jgi:hypothetical protein